jgi:hypothetical protein
MFPILSIIYITLKILPFFIPIFFYIFDDTLNENLLSILLDAFLFFMLSFVLDFLVMSIAISYFDIHLPTPIEIPENSIEKIEIPENSIEKIEISENQNPIEKSKQKPILPKIFLFGLIFMVLFLSSESN